MSEKTQRTHVTINNEIHASFKKICTENGIRMNFIVEKLLEGFIKENTTPAGESK